MSETGLIESPTHSPQLDPSNARIKRLAPNNLCEMPKASRHG